MSFVNRTPEPAREDFFFGEEDVRFTAAGFWTSSSSSEDEEEDDDEVATDSSSEDAASSSSSSAPEEDAALLSSTSEVECWSVGPSESSSESATSFLDCFCALPLNRDPKSGSNNARFVVRGRVVFHGTIVCPYLFFRADPFNSSSICAWMASS